jgi:hypothetical protein
MGSNTKGLLLTIAGFLAIMGIFMLMQQCASTVGYEYKRDPGSVIFGFLGFAVILILLVKFFGKN